jgi:Rrf2 family transcriptional regulator, iron-sulfur cluster assembly transcription factor
MSVLFSRPCEYALQTVLYIALKPQGEMTSIRELTSKHNIPYHFLSKILQRLANKGILSSMTGPGGGYALAKSPKEFSLYDIVEAVDGDAFITKCVMGFAECSDVTPCAVHLKWKSLRAGVQKMLMEKNILEMARDMNKKEYR